MQGAERRTRSRAEYARIARRPAPPRLARPRRRRAGRSWSRPTTRRTASSPACPSSRAGDVGMHVLVAPADTPGPRLHPAVMRRVHRRSASPTRASARVVVEPDVRNERDRRAQRRGRLRRATGTSTLPDKTRRCSASAPASDFDASAARGVAARVTRAHLTPAAWRDAQRRLVAKAIAEFAHERLLAPEPDGDGRLASPRRRRIDVHLHGARGYAARALGRRPRDRSRARSRASRRRSTRRSSSPSSRARSASRRSCCRRTSRRSPRTLAGVGLEARHRRRPSAELRRTRTSRTIEAAMTEGHPGVRRQQRPDRLRPRRLRGVRARDRAAGAAASGSPHAASTTHLSLRRRLDERELYAASSARTPATASTGGCASSGSTRPTTSACRCTRGSGRNKLADHVRARRGPRATSCSSARAPTSYRAQQSIRTFFNPDRPERHYVKTALSIQNMGFMRGLSPAYMAATPADQRLGRRRRRRPTRAARLRVHGAARARGDRLHRRRLPPARHARSRRTRRCSPRSGARARCRGSRAGERLATMAVAAAPRRGRRRAGRRR